MALKCVWLLCFQLICFILQPLHELCHFCIKKENLDKTYIMFFHKTICFISISNDMLYILLYNHMYDHDNILYYLWILKVARNDSMYLQNMFGSEGGNIIRSYNQHTFSSNWCFEVSERFKFYWLQKTFFSISLTDKYWIAKQEFVLSLRLQYSM